MMTKLDYEIILKSDRYEPEGLLITASSSSQESIKKLIDCCLEANKVTYKFQYMVVELHGKSDSYLISFPLFSTKSSSHNGCYIFFPGLFSFSFLLIYGYLGLGYWGWGLGLDFLRLGL